MLTIDRRCELLALADADRMIDLADRCLVDQPNPDLILVPQVGSIVMTVREPVESIRFHLGDVMVTRAEVEHRGERGWAMRMGADEAAALAAAICAAEAQAVGPMAPEIDELCRSTEAATMAQRRDEWNELQPTVVSFTELEA